MPYLHLDLCVGLHDTCMLRHWWRNVLGGVVQAKTQAGESFTASGYQSISVTPLVPHFGPPSTWFISLPPLITVLHFLSLSLLIYLKALSLCSVSCACGKCKRSVLVLLFQAYCLLRRQRQALQLVHLLNYWQHREWVLTLSSVAIASQHAALTVVILFLEGLSWA